MVDQDQSAVVIGHEKMFWMRPKEHGYDLTHPATPELPLVYPRISLECSVTSITADRKKTALLIIDTQSFNLSRALKANAAALWEAEENI